MIFLKDSMPERDFSQNNDSEQGFIYVKIGLFQTI